MSDLDKPALPVVERHIVHATGLTKREYSAIHLRVPNSGNDELDAMIHQRLRDDIAISVLSGLLASHANPNGNYPHADEANLKNLPADSYKYADAMMNTRKGGE